jgi:tetratricopeptide (TPR) repeat protein
MLSKSKLVASLLLTLNFIMLLPTSGLAGEDRKYQIHYALFKIYEAQKRFPEESAELHELIKLRPNEPSLRGLLGKDLFAATKYSAALVEFNSASKFDPSNPDYAGMKGRCDMQLRRYGAAVTDFTNAVRSMHSGGTDYRPELQQALQYVENERQQNEYKKQQVLRKKDDDDD